MIEENKNNNNETNNVNLDYSFDFASQVNKPENTNVQPANVQNNINTNIGSVEKTEPVAPQPSPVAPMPETELPASTQEPAPTPVSASVETPNEPETTVTAAPAQEINIDALTQTTNEEPAQNVGSQPEQTVSQESDTDKASNKNTFAFIVILAVIIVAFIVALPFIKAYLG